MRIPHIPVFIVRSRILLIVLVSVLVGLSTSFSYYRYYGNFVGTGILLFDGDVASYRRIATDSSDTQRVDSWIAVTHAKDQDESVETFRASLNSKAGFDQHFQPFLRVTKTDIRDMVSFKDDVTNQIDGVAITFQSSSSVMASALVRLGAQYLRDAALTNGLFQWLQLESSKASIEIAKWDEVIRNKSFQVGLLNEKLTGLRNISVPQSEREREGQRDILSLTETTAKFLPLSVQRIGVESDLVDVRRELSNAKRELAMNRYILKFVTGAFISLPGQESGTHLLSGINALFDADEKSIAGTADESSVLDARQRIRLQLEAFRQRYVLRPLLAHDSPQVTDRSGRAPLYGSLAALGVALLLSIFIVMPRLIRWILAPEESRL